MDKTKQTLLIAVIAVLAVLAGGWQFLVSPQRSSVNSLKAQQATVDQGNQTLQGKIQALKAEAVEGPAAKAALEAVARRLPADLAEARLVSSLVQAAHAANIDLATITPGAPALVASAAPAVAVPTVTGSAGAAAVPARAPANPNQLYSLPLNLTVNGDYFDLEMFVHNLEGLERAVLINSLTLTASPATAGGTVTSAPTTAPTSVTKAKAPAGKAAAKPVPGSAAAAQAAAAAAPAFVPDANTLSLTISASVFSMYSAAPPAAVVVPTTPTTPTK